MPTADSPDREADRVREASDEQRTLRTGDARVVRQVFDELPKLIIALEGPEHRIVATTAAYRDYVGRAEMIGTPVFEVFPETLVQQAIEVMEHVYRTGNARSMREIPFRFPRPDTGSRMEVIVDVQVSPRHGRDGSITGIIMDAVDVTDRARTRPDPPVRAGSPRAGSLQAALLASTVPVLPGARLAASYLVADADAAGGDWFDALPLPDGRVALVVGDVVGRGLSASAVMGQLRVLVQDRLTQTGDIGVALNAADNFARRVESARAATVCIALLDPATGELTYCTAGHPPPLLVPAHGPAGYLPHTGGGPIGVGSRFPSGTARIEHDELLLLYTDGILERTGAPPPDNAAELAAVVRSVAAERSPRDAPERVVLRTAQLLGGATTHSDDITLLAAERVHPAPGFAAQVPATPEALAGFRHDLTGWLSAAGIGGQVAQRLRHAVNELVTNSIEHAYLDSAGPDTVTVTAELAVDGRLRVQVFDRGAWREPQPSDDRGLGLTMAGDLVDTLRIEHDAAGTTATVQHAVTRPVHLLGTAGPGQAARNTAPRDGGSHDDESRGGESRDGEPLRVVARGPADAPLIEVTGPVDTAGTPRLYAEIRRASMGGCRALTVDLSGVTHLASSGVATLYRLLELSTEQATELTLRASPGSVASMILALVALPNTIR